MTLQTHDRPQAARTAGTNSDREPSAAISSHAQVTQSAARHDEQAARAVMHPDYHDPDWRYYFGAMAVAS